MYKILASTASADSAMKLRDSIEKQLGMKAKSILVSKSSSKSNGNTVILRYGCSYGHLDNEPYWGDPTFSELCINKLATANALRGLVRVPEFFNDHRPTEWPVLLRSTLTGCASEGITLCHNVEDMRKAWKTGSYWTPFIQHSMEIRVLAVFNEDKETAKRIYKKVPRDSDESSSEEFVAGLGGEDNTKWLLKEIAAYPKVVRIIENIEDTIIGLDGTFVAFDMIYSDVEKDWVVLEMNSGPWLSLPAAEWLARLFIRDNGSIFK